MPPGASAKVGSFRGWRCGPRTGISARDSSIEPRDSISGERGGTYPCVYNAANEVAVQAFLEGRIGFLDIAAAVEDVLVRVDGSPARDLDELVEADAQARVLAQRTLAAA